MEAIQLELPLFPHPSFAQLCTRYGYDGVTVELNRRMRRSWQAVHDPITGKRRLRVPATLEQAPEEVKLAVLRWAAMPRPRTKARKQAAVREKKELEAVVWNFLGRSGNLQTRGTRIDRAKLRSRTRGTVHDLREILESANGTWFEGKVESEIRWGIYASTTSYHRKCLDSEGNRFDLITIAGYYDHPDVPRFAVEAVVCHEMLHIVLPPYRKNGRTVYHGPEFRRVERTLPHFSRWRTWERENAHRLVRSLKLMRKRALA